jgi:hypothetical protein
LRSNWYKQENPFFCLCHLPLDHNKGRKEHTMKLTRLLLASLLLAAASLGTASAHTTVRVGVGIGVGYPGYYGGYGYGPRYPGYYGGYYGPRYYGPAYYPYAAPYYAAPVYAAPVVVTQPVVVQPQPQVYVEQPQLQSSGIQPRDNSPYWYFCAERNAYYPYVKSCASGWEQHTPTTPANQ